MRRLPIYFLVDVSESMVGEPIEQVQKGMRNIIQDLRVDPYSLETVWTSVIAFAGKAKCLSPLTELYKFYPPTFPIGGGTSLGNALNFLMDELDRSLVKTTLEAKGDWKPIIFLFTDGNPTDNYEKAFTRWNLSYRRACNLVVISIGDNVNGAILGQISDNVLKLSETDEHSFSQFFKWVTASIKTSSVSVSDYGNDEMQLAPTEGINLEKIDTSINNTIDENFVVIVGKCQNTGKEYLIKFAKRVKAIAGYEWAEALKDVPGIEPYLAEKYKLIGAYPIDGQEYKSLSDSTPTNRNIHTTELIGQPTCPCCGNQFGMVICECGNVFCVGEDSHSKCPWCGLEGELSSVGEGGIDVSRSRG